MAQMWDSDGRDRFAWVTYETMEKMINTSLLAKGHATSHGQGSSTYAPIVQALTRLSDSEKTKLRSNFDIA